MKQSSEPDTTEPFMADVNLPSLCSLCDKPAPKSYDFTGCRHLGMTLGREPLCDDCVGALIEGATLGDLAVQIFKRRGLW